MRDILEELQASRICRGARAIASSRRVWRIPNFERFPPPPRIGECGGERLQHDIPCIHLLASFDSWATSQVGLGRSVLHGAGRIHSEVQLQRGSGAQEGGGLPRRASLHHHCVQMPPFPYLLEFLELWDRQPSETKSALSCSRGTGPRIEL